MLLDQEGFECDPINRMEGDTPLHSAVRWANGLREEQWEEATELIKMMIEAGSDPKYVPSHHKMPSPDVATALRAMLMCL
jgi:hypothetical protein